MLKLGKPTIKTFRGTYLLRSEKIPSIGSRVYDSKGRPIGVVIDIFGPVSLPYIEIKPSKPINSVVYIKKGE